VASRQHAELLLVQAVRDVAGQRGDVSDRRQLVPHGTEPEPVLRRDDEIPAALRETPGERQPEPA